MPGRHRAKRRKYQAVVIFKCYKALTTGAGYLPEGNCLATLTLDENRQPTWSDLDPEFERLGVPWFENSVRLGVLDNLPPLKPYSEEAIAHLIKHQLPSQGFVMVKVSDTNPKAEPAKTSAAPAAPAKPFLGYNHPLFNPPPRLNRPPTLPRMPEATDTAEATE